MKEAMKILLIGAALLVPAISAKAEKPLEKVLSFQLDYKLVLAADGSIEILKSQREDINKVLADNLEKQIRSWKFTPASIDGKSARTETTLWLTVDATPNGDGNFNIRVADASTGAAVEKGTLAPPKYPAGDLAAGNEAVLRLYVTYDANGNVIKVDRPGKKATGFRSFEHASFQTAKKWRFNPEKVNGIGVPGQVVVPVAFCMPPNNCASLFKGSQEKEELALEVARQSVPLESKVSIQRVAGLN